jgi:hypothetical protein
LRQRSLEAEVESGTARAVAALGSLLFVMLPHPVRTKHSQTRHGQNAFVTEVKNPVILVVMPVNDATVAKEMRVASKAYSIRSWPESSRRRSINQVTYTISCGTGDCSALDCGS